MAFRSVVLEIVTRQLSLLLLIWSSIISLSFSLESFIVILPFEKSLPR